MSALAELPEPHTTEDDGNLIAYRLGPHQFLGYNVALDEWQRNPTDSMSHVRTWYDCLEAGRRKKAAGLRENTQHDRRPPSRAHWKWQRGWLVRPWA